MEKLLTSHQVVKLLNVWHHTLRCWEREGKLIPLRTPAGHRRYKESQVMALIGEEVTESVTKHCAVYARVFTAKQAEAGNLQRQKERLITYAVEKGYQVKAVYNEIASGLNENRRELAKLAKTATNGEIDVIVSNTETGWLALAISTWNNTTSHAALKSTLWNWTKRNHLKKNW